MVGVVSWRQKLAVSNKNKSVDVSAFWLASIHYFFGSLVQWVKHMLHEEQRDELPSTDAEPTRAMIYLRKEEEHEWRNEEFA